MKSSLYDRGLMLNIQLLLPQMPKEFSITAMMNAVMKAADQPLRGRDADLLRDRIKRQMEYFEANGLVSSAVVEQQNQTPPYITIYTKAK